MTETHTLFGILRQSADADCVAAVERLVADGLDHQLSRINGLAFAHSPELDDEKTIAAFLPCLEFPHWQALLILPSPHWLNHPGFSGCISRPAAWRTKSVENRPVTISRRTMIERISRFLRSIETRSVEPGRWEGHCTRQALQALDNGDIEERSEE